MKSMSRRVRFGLVMTLALPAAPATAADPIVLFGGRITLGGEVNLTIAPEDDGYFNYNGYRNNVLRRGPPGGGAGLGGGGPPSVGTPIPRDHPAPPPGCAPYPRARPREEGAFGTPPPRAHPAFAGLSP